MSYFFYREYLKIDANSEADAVRGEIVVGEDENGNQNIKLAPVEGKMYKLRILVCGGRHF